MTVVDRLRMWMDLSVGNRGALRNCELELDRRRQVDVAVRRLQRRMPAAAVRPTAASSGPSTPA